MMNLYREEEKPQRRSFGEFVKDKIDDIRLSFTTSATKRNFTIKQVTKWIKNLDVKDAETVKKIDKAIISLEICDSRYGKTIDKAVVQEFIEKIQGVPEYADYVRRVSAEMKCYDMGKVLEEIQGNPLDDLFNDPETRKQIKEARKTEKQEELDGGDPLDGLFNDPEIRKQRKEAREAERKENEEQTKVAAGLDQDIQEKQ